MDDGPSIGDERRALAERNVRDRQLVMLGACWASEKARQKAPAGDWTSSRIGAAAHDASEQKHDLRAVMTDLGIQDWDGTGHPLEKVAEHVRLDARINEVMADFVRVFSRTENAHGFTAAEKSACVEQANQVIERAAAFRHRPRSAT